jgi:hypothetical protein
VLSIDNSPDNMDTAITVIHGKGAYKHPSEEGTSVDDEMVSEEEQSNRSSGLTVMPSLHIRYLIHTSSNKVTDKKIIGNNLFSINRRIEMPPAFHFPENQPPPSDLLSGQQVKPEILF